VGSGGAYEAGVDATGTSGGGPGGDGGVQSGGGDGGGSSLDDSGVGGGDGGAGLDTGSGSGVTVDLPPGYFASLDWTVMGTAGSYAGTVNFGQAKSHEFVVGGIEEGDGYMLTLSGKNLYGEPCTGTSALFSVKPGETVAVALTIQCVTGDGAVATMVTTGNIAIEAGVAP
jgi:hypothetical protein